MPVRHRLSRTCLRNHWHTSTAQLLECWLREVQDMEDLPWNAGCRHTSRWNRQLNLVIGAKTTVNDPCVHIPPSLKITSSASVVKAPNYTSFPRAALVRLIAADLHISVVTVAAVSRNALRRVRRRNARSIAAFSCTSVACDDAWRVRRGNDCSVAALACAAIASDNRYARWV